MKVSAKIYLLFPLFVMLLFLYKTGFALNTRGVVSSISTEMYEILLKKSGIVELYYADGRKVATLSPPTLKCVGKEEKLLRVSAFDSYREPVRNDLGEGIGLFLRGKEFITVIVGYPGKQFITVSVVYTNKTKKTQNIEKIIPLSGNLDLLSPESFNGVVLDNGNVLETMVDFPQISRELNRRSNWNLAVHDYNLMDTILLGYLQFWKSFPTVELKSDPENKKVLYKFECIYDPPLNLNPGESIITETIYLSLGDRRPVQSLLRYGSSIAMFNKLQKNYSFVPHGWDSWSTSINRNINETTVLQELDFIDKNLKRYGWTNFAIDAGWERGPTDWEPHPEKFPRGLKPIVEEIHKRGMTACIWIDLFTIPIDSTLAKDHPDWLVIPNSKGKLLLGDNKRILDVTIPEAYEYVKKTCQKISKDWGFDGIVEADFVYHLLLGEGYRNSKLTKVEVMCRGLQAINEGLGDSKFLTSMIPIQISCRFADGLRIGFDNKPLWESPLISGNFGCVEALTNFARKFYLFPFLGLADQDCVFLGKEETYKRWNIPEHKRLTRSQIIAWATGTSLTGGVFKIGDRFTSLSKEDIDILRKCLPRISKSAIPVDLFENPFPKIWCLPIWREEFSATIVGVFNWNENTSSDVLIQLDSLGLDEGKYYALYDFWNEKFVGIVKNSFNISLPPASVSLFCLRLLKEEPIFLASNHHYTMGILDVNLFSFNPSTKELEGRMKVVENTPYKITIYDPNKWGIASYSLNLPDSYVSQENGIITIQFQTPPEASEVWWKINFK